MKKLVPYSTMIYAAYMLQTILLSLPFLFYGYKLVLYIPVLWVIVGVLLEIIFVVLCIVKRKKFTKPANIYAQFLPLLTLIYSVVFALLIPEADGLFSILHLLFSFISCFVIAFMYKSNQALKVTFIVIHSLILAFLLQISFFSIVMGNFGENSVVTRISSPNDTHTAIVIDSDQGALGGNTYVHIDHNHGEIDLGICKFTKETTTLYQGKYMEYENMTLHWIDENTLNINGKSYNID